MKNTRGCVLILGKTYRDSLIVPAEQALAREGNAVSILEYPLIIFSPNQWVFYGEEEQSI